MVMYIAFNIKEGTHVNNNEIFKTALEQIKNLEVNYDPFEEKKYYIDLIKRIKLVANHALEGTVKKQREPWKEAQ